jgi:hypothetical protein
MTEGHRHYWERPSIGNAIVGIIFLPIILTILIGWFLFLIFHIPIAALFMVFFILTVVAYMVMGFYSPKSVLQVREEAVAKRNKRRYLNIGSPVKEDDDDYDDEEDGLQGNNRREHN